MKNEKNNTRFLAFSILIAAIIIALSLVFVGINLSNSHQTNAQQTTATNNSNGTAVQPTGDSPSKDQGNQASLIVDDLIDNDSYLGSSEAKVVVIEFSDYQCPFCKRFEDDSFAQLKSEYIDSGKVQFVYRDFPLSSIHPMAQKAAEAVECAGEQQKYWEYHDMVFQNQQSLSIDNLKLWAGKLGLNQEEFDSCLDSGKYKQEVLDDLSAGTSLSLKNYNSGSYESVRGTPSFVIGLRGKEPVLLVGAQPFSAFKQVIDSLLS